MAFISQIKLSDTTYDISAIKLKNTRTIQTNLASTTSASFDGSANITPGVTGTLPIANGGTGATTAAGARTNLEVPSKTGSGASGTWGINISGNAATATKLATARTISLTGSVTGSGTFDGSGNLSIATSTNHSHSYLPLSGGTMTGSPVIKFPSSAGSIAASDPMAITYGCISSYGTLCINANTDNSGTEYVILTAGKGLSSSTSDGLAIGQNSITWQNNNLWGKYLMKRTTIDASSLNQDTWYPVSIYVPPSENVRIEVEVALDSGTTPSWSTHNYGFSVRKIWETNGAGWGTIPITRNIYVSTYSFASVDPVRGLDQNTMASVEIVYVRGGGKYFFKTSPEAGTPTLNSGGYSWSSGSYSYSAPITTTAPAAIYAYASITVPQANNASTATKLATARTISLTGSVTGSGSFDGSGNLSIATTTNHSHNYAGSSSAGGSANSAVKLDTATAGDSNTPVYFSGGKPVACTSLDLNTSGNAATATAAHSLIVQGTITAINGTSRYPSGLRIGGIYNSGYPFSYGTTLTMETSQFGAELIFNGLGGGGATGSGDMRFRTHSDWSTSEWGDWRTVLDSSNYTSYTVTKTGGGASGTWPISITGNAASASSVAWGNVTGKPSTFTPSSHTHSVSQLTWAGSENLTCTGNSSEWSIDMSSGAPDSYFHIWSGYLGGTCMKFENRTGLCRAPYGVYGGVWNDYAEFRICNEEFKPGQVVLENGDDTLSIASQRLQRGCSIVSDTFGFAIGETDEAKCPIAVSGRVLAYGYESREEFKKHIGWPVCSGPNGTVSIMTEEEEEKYPSRIIGTISAVPDYETWGTSNVEVNNRIWIKVK